MTKAKKKTTARKKKDVRIPERASDMPGGPGGGAPITPPKQKTKAKRAE